MAPSSPSGLDLHHPMRGFPLMGVLNCIVVEDNNKQSALLKDYIAKTPNLSFSGKCESAADVYHLLGYPASG
jgi:hypothetical protein